MAETPGHTASRGPRGVSLTGWKEIANYFRKGVRTVQRWERDLDLPVHRLNTGRGETVYAFPAELDAWRQALDSRPARAGWDREEEADAASGRAGVNGDRAGNGGGGNGGTGHEGATAPDASVPGAVPPVAAASGPAPDGTTMPGSVPQRQAGAESREPTRRQRVRTTAWLVVALATLAVVGMTAIWQPWHRDDAASALPSGVPGAPGAAASGAPRQPSEIKVDVDAVRVFDADGRLLFTKAFGAQLATHRYTERARALTVGPLDQTVDLDGDGTREVVFLADFPSDSEVDSLVVYDASGNRRFEINPDHTVRFGSETYAPPWQGYRLFVTGPPERRLLWVAWVDQVTGQFPCLLQQVSPRGKVLGEFWSAGYVESVTEVVVQGRRLVAVGAANNDHRGASLALLDADRVTGAAPAVTFDKTCLDCPAGEPVAFVVFPQMSIDRKIDALPWPVHVRQNATGNLQAVIRHAGSLNGRPEMGDVLYWLGPDFVPRRAEVTPEFVTAHQRLHEAGEVDHPFSDRDRQEAWPALVWKGGKRFEPVTGTTTR